ncbi:MAG: hypothetical protein Q9183_003732 [Haloplaca sp. 2 TL-2023]
MNSSAPGTSPPFLNETLRPRPPLIASISDYNLSLLIPVIVHWFTAAVYEIFQQNGIFERYRIHSPEEETNKNTISRWQCLRGVLLVQSRPLTLRAPSRSSRRALGSSSVYPPK